MIITYRYVRKKLRERKAKRVEQQSSNQAPPIQLEEHTAGSVSPASANQANEGDNEGTHESDAEPPGKKKKRWKLSSEVKWNIMLMAALAIPVFLETLDYTVVATAQVHIASVFNRLDLQSYIGTVYLLTSTVFLPPFASVADIFGRHWALQLGLSFFIVGSAISTGSHNMPTMLAGRGVAGMGAAGLLAAVRIILTDSGSLNTNNWQQAILFVLYTIGYCLGPFIGGALVTVSFRWIFAINLPCAAVAMLVCFLLLRGRTKAGQASKRLPVNARGKETFLDKLLRVDWVGAGLFMAGGILVLLALNWGSNEVWNSAKVIACFVVGGASIVLFLVWEYFLETRQVAFSPSSSRLRATDPMIPLALFKSLDICIVMYGTFVNGMVMLVMFYFVAIFFVIVEGLSSTNSGVQLIYFAPGMGGGSLISMRLVKWFRQPRYPIVLGGAVSAIALGLISMGMDKNKQGLVNGFMALAGVGTGLCIGPLAVQARFSQPVERNAIVSALTLFFRSFGGTVGLAQCAAVLNGKVKSYIKDLINSGVLSGDQAAAVAQAAAAGMDSLDSINSLPSNVQTIVRDAFRQGTRWAFISLVPWAGVAFVASLFLSKIRDSDRKEPQTAEQPTYDANGPKDEETTMGTPNMKENAPNGVRP